MIIFEIALIAAFIGIVLLTMWLQSICKCLKHQLEINELLRRKIDAVDAVLTCKHETNMARIKLVRELATRNGLRLINHKDQLSDIHKKINTR